MGRIVEDVRHAPFRGQATNIHIRVHPEQPMGEDAFGYAFADILNNCAEPKQYDAAGKKHMPEAGFQTGIPYPLKKTPRFPIAAPPYIERICYATFNYRAGYTADKHIYAKETVLTAFREYPPSPFLPTPLRPSLWVVLTVHLVMYMKRGDVRNYLARHDFRRNEGKHAGQGGRKKGPLPSADRFAKALDLAEEWHQSELGRYYQAGECPPANVMFKGKEEVCEVTPHWEAAAPTFGGKPIVSTVQRNKIVSLPMAGTTASPKLHGLVGVLAQRQKRAGGTIKHNTNAVKNLAATQAVPGDNVDEGCSPEPQPKKAKQPAKPATGGLARGRGGAGARAGGGALGSPAGRRAAVAAAATREQQAGRRGGPGQNRM
eukprot:jgi/Tetstr1/425344/TSEL_015793.t1